jgi:hypothetical protein
MDLHVLPDISEFPEAVREELEALTEIANESREAGDDDGPALTGDVLLSSLFDDIESAGYSCWASARNRRAIMRWQLSRGILRVVSDHERQNTVAVSTSGRRVSAFEKLDGQYVKFVKWLHR